VVVATGGRSRLFDRRRRPQYGRREVEFLVELKSAQLTWREVVIAESTRQ
jgi:hypothetical protein